MRHQQQRLEYALRQAGQRLQLQIKTARALGRVSSASELGRLIRAVPYAVLVADDRQRYVDANRPACQLLGYTKAELLQLTVGEVVALDRPLQRSAKRWRQFVQSHVQESEIPLRRSNQRIVVVSYWAFSNAIPGLHISVMSPSIASIDEAASPSRRALARYSAAEAPRRRASKGR